jgi:stage II sporulation protein R
MKYIWKKRLVCGGIAILLAAGSSSMLLHAREQRLQEHLAKEVFRFHVLANSNSEQDQTLKLAVKERVIAYMETELPESESVSMTQKWAVSHIEEIVEVARETLLEHGCMDEVRANVVQTYFPDKTYGDITFPRGEYNALRIEIGEAQGENWWCVLYPNLCFLDAVHAVVPEEGKEKLRNVLDEEEYEMVTAFSKFRIGWFFF